MQQLRHLMTPFRPLMRSLSVSGRLSAEDSRPIPLMRKVKKIYSPENEEIPVKSTGLEIHDRGREIAFEAQKRLKNVKFQRNRSRKTTKNEEDDFEGDINYLPDDFDIEKLPRFKKIEGYDKTNKTLKQLARNLSRVNKRSENVVLEGKRLIIDAIKAGIYPKIFVFSRLNLLIDFPFDKSKNLAMYQIPYRSVQSTPLNRAKSGSNNRLVLLSEVI